MLLSWQFDVPIIATAIAGLVICGLVLSLGPVVYRTVEVIQLVLVAGIFVMLVGLSVALVRWETVLALAEGATNLGHIPDGIHLPMLLGALAFAGAGGSVNLAQSNYIKDKGYGMGRYVGRITSPFTGREEAVSEVGAVFEPNPENLARWHVWWRRANLEHFVTFYLLCLGSLALFCLLAATLLEPGAPVAEGFGFIKDELAAIESHFGAVGRWVFLLTGVAVLFSTELALLDAVARVAADLLKVGFLHESKIGLSQIYAAVVWAMVLFGIVVLMSGFDQPLALLVISAALNGFVMFLYSVLLLWLSLTTFHGALRPHPVRVAALVASVGFFGYFSVLTLIDRLTR
jgi:hypothetical protein